MLDYIKNSSFSRKTELLLWKLMSRARAKDLEYYNTHTHKKGVGGRGEKKKTAKDFVIFMFKDHTSRTTFMRLFQVKYHHQ